MRLRTIGSGCRLWVAVLGICLLLGSQAAALAPAKLPEALSKSEPAKLDLTALLNGYGPFIKGVEVGSGNQVFLRMQDGRKIIYDDGRRKSFEEKLDCPDLEDMLSQPYIPGRAGLKVAPDLDPGRIRVDDFFQAVYGDSAGQVKGNLAPVAFAGGKVSFNSQNGAAVALARVGQKISCLFSANPGLKAWVLPLQGSYNRRDIAGTSRLSPHSWGIALDLHKGAYWRWSRVAGPTEILALRSAYPWEIVAAFEEEGFIWGGKWYHFDIMHFEYRPELLAKAKLAAGK